MTLKSRYVGIAISWCETTITNNSDTKYEWNTVLESIINSSVAHIGAIGRSSSIELVLKKEGSFGLNFDLRKRFANSQRITAWFEKNGRKNRIIVRKVRYIYCVTHTLQNSIY